MMAKANLQAPRQLSRCYRCGVLPCDCRIPMRYDADEAQAATNLWGFNCGPGALAAVLGVRPNEIRPVLREFEQKRYTNPRLMYAILRSLGLYWKPIKPWGWPRWGLVRIQWAGPWTAEGRPPKARYRHTHWIATSNKQGKLASRADRGSCCIFDINAIRVGGWIAYREWDEQLVPWLLRRVEPEANGKWWPTHLLELIHIQCKNVGQRLESTCHKEEQRPIPERLAK